MPPIADPSCPRCARECSGADQYCWSCGAPLDLASAAVVAGSATRSGAVVVDGHEDNRVNDRTRRWGTLGVLVAAAVLVAGALQLRQDRTAPDPIDEPLALESVLADATETPSTDSAGPTASADSTELGTTGRPMIRVDERVLAERDFDHGHLVFADFQRRDVQTLDLTTGAVGLDSSELYPPETALLRQVSDLGIVMANGATIERWGWDGSSQVLEDVDPYLGGNTISFARLPTGVPSVLVGIAEEVDGGRVTVPFGSPYFVIDDSIFTHTDTSILRFGPGLWDWQEVGKGTVAALLGDGLLAFDCVSGEPQADEPCLMDIYQADGTRAVSSRTASQLRWNITAGGREDVGLVLSHNGEMLAEPTQVGLGIWNTSGGTLRRISRVALRSLHWTADDRALLGLGPAVDGWSPVMELDIARGTTLPIGVEVAAFDLVGFGSGDRSG